MKNHLLAPLLLAAALLSACGEPTASKPAASQMTIVGGDGQMDTIDAVLRYALAVEVTDVTGKPVQGAKVTWSAGGAGTITPGGRTDERGIATAVWKLGHAQGEVMATATTDGVMLGAMFQATIRSGAPASGTISFTPDTMVTYGAAQPIRVRFLDRTGNPASDYPVDWGSATPAVPWEYQPHTDWNGEANATWRPAQAGLNTATITSGSASLTASVRVQGYAAAALGTAHTCALTTVGRVYCWGQGNGGELGDGTSTRRGKLLPVAGEHVFVQIAAGESTTCGLEATGTMYCWGADGYGQAGTGTVAASHPAPVVAAGGMAFRGIAVGGRTACGLNAAGAAYCWGDNTEGQLGDGTVQARTSPVAVAGGLAFRTLSASPVATCGITTADALYCWGSSMVFGVDSAGVAVRVRQPVPVAAGMRFREVSVGSRAVCAATAATAAGEAYCWGRNGVTGWAGLGAPAYVTAPTRTLGASLVRSVSEGGVAGCAVTTDNTGYCWGTNVTGVVGNGSNANALTPTPVSGLTGWARIAVGNGHACGITLVGTLYCWGEGNSGQLGTNLAEDSNVPAAVLPPV
jgi:alpha-tubulin suppressor-like RCC1 family protein